jgi:tetratricopeptide (TPR) repeat protein
VPLGSSARSPSDLTAEERQAYALGRACFEQGDDVQAQRWLAKLVATREGFADVQYMLGLLSERRGDLEDAARCLEQALRINSAYVEARLALVSVCEQLGDYVRAREVASRGSSRAAAEGIDSTTRGKLANLQAALGDAYREAGHLREAVEAYRKALDLCPDFHDIRHRLGVALREAGLPAQAAQEFRRIQQASPDFLAASVQLGVTYYSLGRAEEALREWQQVLAKDASREDARWYLRLVRSAAAAPAL